MGCLAGDHMFDSALQAAVRDLRIGAKVHDKGAVDRQGSFAFGWVEHGVILRDLLL